MVMDLVFDSDKDIDGRDDADEEIVTLIWCE
jgi:hypothetical protein